MGTIGEYSFYLKRLARCIADPMEDKTDLLGATTVLIKKDKGCINRLFLSEFQTKITSDHNLRIIIEIAQD
jgi:hypothetical protein